MPNTLTQNAQIIDEAVADIKDEIALKGVTVPDPCPITTIPSLIESISGGGSQDTQQLINLIESDSNFSLSIPSGTTSIGVYALFNSKVASVIIPSSVTVIGNYAFQNSSLTSITIPSTVLSLGVQAFRQCYSLETVSIAGTIETIPNSCFTGCNRITSLTIGNGIKYIEGSAFSGCERLPSVKLPSTILTIGQTAFHYCRHLALVDLTDFTDPTAIPSLESINAFQNISANCVFLVANSEMQAAFSSATNWSTFTFTIQGA